MTAAWTRKEGKNPEGGLNAKGRASAKAEGMNLKPPVKSGDNPRRASFLARMGNMPGPMEKDGKPTRLALALKAWGASSKEDAKSKAKNISERNKWAKLSHRLKLSQLDKLMTQAKKQLTNIKGAGRPKGVPNKSTTKAREAIAAFVDGNAHLLQTWLEQVAMDERYGPKTAFDCFMAVTEYHVPKLARQEHVGADNGPIELVVKWQDEK